MKIEMESIGTIHTEFKEIEGMPIQPTGAKGVKGTIEIKDKYVDGLKDLNDFSHIHIFATRSPKRPNRIGMSVVKVNDVKDNKVCVENIDVLDGTPLLDIKPYVPQLYEDTIDELKIGWFERNHQKAKSQKSDDRFK